MTPDTERITLEKAKTYWRYVKQGRSIADYQILCDIALRCFKLIPFPVQGNL